MLVRNDGEGATLVQKLNLHNYNNPAHRDPQRESRAFLFLPVHHFSLPLQLEYPSSLHLTYKADTTSLALLLRDAGVVGGD